MNEWAPDASARCRAEMEGKPRVLPRMSVELESVHKKEPPAGNMNFGLCLLCFAIRSRIE